MPVNYEACINCEVITKFDNGEMRSPSLCLNKGSTEPWLTKKLAESSSQRGTHVLQAPRLRLRGWPPGTIQSEYARFLELPNITEKVS